MQWLVGPTSVGGVIGTTTAAGLAVAAGGHLASRRRIPSWFGAAFAAGLIAAFVAVDLLPGAAEGGLGLLPLGVIAAASLALTWWLLARTTRGECCSAYTGRVAATGIAGHGLLEGAVLGLALGFDAPALPLLLVAFVVHKAAEGYALTTTLHRSGSRRTWPWLLVAALAPTIGALVGPALLPAGNARGTVLALLAGALAAVALTLVTGARTGNGHGAVRTRQRSEVLMVFGAAAALAVVVTGYAA